MARSISTTNMDDSADSLLAQLQSLNSEALTKSSRRSEIYDALRAAMLSIELPVEAARRVSFGASIGPQKHL